MIQRCTNPKASQYKDYGGRGIKVCARWLVFDNFLADMGTRPEGKYRSGRAKYTIERKNNNGDYSKKNCVWATYKDQSRNRKTGRMIRHQGKEQLFAAWVEQLGLNYKIVHQRLARGWSAHRAFSVPS